MPCSSSPRSCASSSGDHGRISVDCRTSISCQQKRCEPSSYSKMVNDEFCDRTEWRRELRANSAGGSEGLGREERMTTERVFQVMHVLRLAGPCLTERGHRQGSKRFIEKLRIVLHVANDNSSSLLFSVPLGGQVLKRSGSALPKSERCDHAPALTVPTSNCPFLCM